VEGDLRWINAMRSKECKGKNETQESGDAVMPAVRGYDAESRRLHGKVLEVLKQAMPMAHESEVGGE